jgi:hypothetical protein
VQNSNGLPPSLPPSQIGDHNLYFVHHSASDVKQYFAGQSQLAQSRVCAAGYVIRAISYSSSTTSRACIAKLPWFCELTLRVIKCLTMSSALGTLSVRRADTAKGSISHNRKGEPEPRASVGSMGPLLAASRSMSSGLEALRKQNSSPTEGTRSLLPQQWQSSKGSVTIKGNQINPDEDLSLLKVRLQAAEADLARRQESYVRRERAWNERIDELEEEISQLKAEAQGWTRTDENMKNLRTMHSKILNNVELVQGRTSKILQEQERDLLRAFRARLFDVQTELEVERSKRDDGASVWIERSRQTQAELDWAKDIADKLDKLNQSLSQDNSRLRAQFKGQEEDRAFLMKQLVLLKRENAKLRQDAQEAHAKQIPNAEDGSARDESSPECSKITSARPARPLSNSTGPKRPSTAGLAEDYSEERYKDIVRRLKRLLGTERRNLRQVSNIFRSFQRLHAYILSTLSTPCIYRHVPPICNCCNNVVS